MKKQNKRTPLNTILLCSGLLFLQGVMLTHVAADDATPLRHKVLPSTESINCKDYSDGTERGYKFGSSGPINNPKYDTGQFFDYGMGRLYYQVCSFNFGEKNEKSFGFVEWESKNRKTKTIVTLLEKPGFCFRGSSFNIVNSKLLVTLSTCDGEKNKDGFSYLDMTYRWNGDKLGAGNFKLAKETYKKENTPYN